MPPTPASPPARPHPIARAAASPLRRLDRRAALAAASVAACVAALALFPAPASAAASAEAVLKRADRTLGTPRALRFEATGTGATFGQAFEPGGPWPKLNLSQFVRTMDYANGAMREDSARSRAEPTGGGAVPLMGAGEQRIQGYVAGRHAWNMVGPAPVAVPVALETRLHDLWTSPHGVIAAARRNAATVDFVTVGGRSLVLASTNGTVVLSRCGGAVRTLTASFCNLSAVARAMPDPAPVMTAALPSSSPMDSPSMLSDCSAYRGPARPAPGRPGGSVRRCAPGRSPAPATPGRPSPRAAAAPSSSTSW
nr:2-phosphosulfolactate phosphatase [Burkholderiaceae bacterium]